MFIKWSVFLFVVHTFSFSDGVEDEWRIYETKFKHHDREEIFIANATADLNFKSNFTVDEWKTLNVGTTCYTGGIMNKTQMVLLFSTPARNGSGITIVPKVFDLNETVSKMEFFHERRNENQTIMVVTYSQTKNAFMWYAVSQHYLNKTWTWHMDDSVSHFNLFKMNKKPFLLINGKNKIGVNSAIVYGFNVATLERWYYQSIPLSAPTSSSCLTNIDTDFYLSITQSNKLLIYQYSDNHFIPYNEISSPKIDQVICFENGFKSFIAFNGFNADIYEITSQGLHKSEIENSNLEGLQFWLSIPVNTYRDESILLCQRMLEHGTHTSFDVDVVTYNGKRFEEHVDIPCSIFGEEQNGLKCLTEYNSLSGILGTTYISAANSLALIVLTQNGTSILFNIEIDLRKINHPAKKELDELLIHKKYLQDMMDDQNKKLSENEKNSKELIIPEITPELKSAEALVGAKNSNDKSPKHFNLKNEIVEIFNEIEELHKKVKDIKPFKQDGMYDTIIFNGPVEVVNDLASNSVISEDKELINLLDDIVRKDQLEHIQAKKTFKNIVLKELMFENVNGISSKDFVSSTDGIVELGGDITFDSPIDVQSTDLATGLINDIGISTWVNVDKLVKDSISFQKLVAINDFGTRLLNGEKMENMKNSNNSSGSLSDILDNVETLFIPGNITVKTLNGHDFEDFLHRICSNNVKCHISTLRLSGDMNVQGIADIDYLNNLQFPEDYVSLEPKKKLIITGAKEFKNITRGYIVTTNNTIINNVDFSKIVTLSGERHNITGTLTFENLEVGSGLNVGGNVKGKEITKFVPNAGLNETTNINANVEFLNLEVLGDIIIKKNFNDTEFNEYLENIILKDENTTIITGTKSFPQGFSVLNNVHIDSATINNIPLDSIISKNIRQHLQIDTITGNVDFDDLYVKGLFDGQNITDLNQTLVKINKNQTIDSKLIFLEDITIKTLKVEVLNGYNKSSEKENSDISYEHLDIESIEVEGNIVGNIENFDLKDVRDKYLKYSGNQNISEPYYIDKFTSTNFKIKHINDMLFDNMFSHQKLMENITDILTYRNPIVQTINVEGNIGVKNVNNKDFGTILEDQSWMKLHRNSSRLTIDGDVYFESLEIKNLANASFDEYISTLVFKNESEVDIHNSINFENGIIVRKLIETLTLNDIALKHILRKAGDQTIIGPIDILGDVTIDDGVTVKEMINNVEVTYILDNFEIGEELLKVKGEIIFQRMSYIRNLTIDGLINKEDFDNLKNRFVYTNDKIHLKNDILFNEKVKIHGNLGISEDINGIVVSEFVPRVVWLTQDSGIQGPVRFAQSVECYESIAVESEINTKLLFGKNFEQHISEGVFLNKGFLHGNFQFKNLAIREDLKSMFINNIDLNTIIPLRSSQTIEGLNISEMSVVHDINVGHNVNGVNLMVEKERTVLNNVEQYIPSEIIFLNNVLIEDNLTTLLINSNPVSKIVTTNTDQNLTAAYNLYSKCLADKDLIVNGLISGINLTYWEYNTISSVNSHKTQHIKDKWSVMNDLNLIGPINGNGRMNDINVTQLVKNIQQREDYFCDIEKRITDDYRNLCKDVSYIYKNTKNQIYKFQYFDELQTITHSKHINYVKHFEHQGKYYLLVNEAKSCMSDLAVFGPGGFSKINTISTGGLSQVEIIKDKEDLYLVSRGLDEDDLVCNIRFSTVIWKWTNEDMQELASIEAQELLQESQVPLTFYGLRHGTVTEFKIDPSNELVILEYKKWDIKEDNAAFIPRGISTGLALRTGKNSIFLNRNDPIVEEEYGLESKATLKGEFKKVWNQVIPGRNGGEVTVVNIGGKMSKKRLLVVASHKESQVQHRLDIVEIYSDPFKGELFDKILTYRPTGLTSIEFENGETLLAFMEDENVLQIYEYKGIEGFKHRSSIRIHANQIFLMQLPTEHQSQPNKVLGLVHNNKITLLHAVMIGHKTKDDLQCIP